MAVTGVTPLGHRLALGTAGICPAVPRAVLIASTPRLDDQTPPSACMPAQRHAGRAGRRGLAAARPDPDRRGDELRHHQRHQHGAALPQRRPRGGPTGRRLPRRGHHRLPQHDAAPRRPAPHHRGQGRSLRHQGRQQRLRRSRPPRARATWSASWPSASRTAAASSPGCTRRSWPRCSCGGMALLLFMGAKQRRRRRDRRRPPDRARHPPARAAAHRRATATRSTTPTSRASSPPARWSLSSSSPSARSPSRARRPSPRRTRPPTRRRSASATTPRRSAGPVYPDGVVSTGDPIFVKLVRRRPRQGSLPPAGQRPASPRRHHGGRAAPRSPTGWSRTIQLAAPKRFTGDYAAADVTLDVPAPAVADPQGREADRRLGGRRLRPSRSRRACTWPGRWPASRSPATTRRR